MDDVLGTLSLRGSKKKEFNMVSPATLATMIINESVALPQEGEEAADKAPTRGSLQDEGGPFDNSKLPFVSLGVQGIIPKTERFGSDNTDCYETAGESLCAGKHRFVPDTFPIGWKLAIQAPFG